MKVSPSKEIRTMVFALSIFVLLCALLIFSCGSLVGAILLVILGGTIVVRCWIALGKTVTFCQEGIYVKIFGFVRFYEWEKVKTKRLFDCTNSYGYKASYCFGAEFSRSEYKRPQWLMPAEYAVFFHPLAYIFVCFAPQDEFDKKVKYPVPYEVDESVFRKAMAEWNVFK